MDAKCQSPKQRAASQKEAATYIRHSSQRCSVVRTTSTYIYYDIDMNAEIGMNEDVINSKADCKINCIVGDYRLIKVRKTIFDTVYVWKCIRRLENQSSALKPTTILNNKIDASKI